MGGLTAGEKLTCNNHMNQVSKSIPFRYGLFDNLINHFIITVIRFTTCRVQKKFTSEVSC